MRIAGFIRNSVVNGVGIRDVLFLQGCEHRCKGCHNPTTWNRDYGLEVTIEILAEQLMESEHHITISGGEPMLQYEELIKLMELIHNRSGKRFWMYTGFRIEELPPHQLEELAKYVDVLVDGRFELEKKDLTLRFRGSSNQRLIDLPKSVVNKRVIEWVE